MDGAQERTRTFTAVKPLAPEASASTNSATWARSVGSREAASLKLRLPAVNAARGRWDALRQGGASSIRCGGDTNSIGAAPRHAKPGHGLRRLRLRRPPCGAPARHGRMADPGGRAQPEPGVRHGAWRPRYAESRAGGEAAVLAVYPDAAIVRPSIVSGPEDDFFNRFAAMAQLSPALPLVGGGLTRFQPVFVGDVAKALAQVAGDPSSGGKTYELAGPAVFTFRQLMELMLREI